MVPPLLGGTNYHMTSLCVCVSALSIMPSHAFRHQMRGISKYSMEIVINLEPFSLKLLHSKVKYTYATMSADFFTCNKPLRNMFVMRE